MASQLTNGHQVLLGGSVNNMSMLNSIRVDDWMADLKFISRNEICCRFWIFKKYLELMIISEVKINSSQERGFIILVLEILWM